MIMILITQSKRSALKKACSSSCMAGAARRHEHAHPILMAGTRPAQLLQSLQERGAAVQPFTTGYASASTKPCSTNFTVSRSVKGCTVQSTSFRPISTSESANTTRFAATSRTLVLRQNVDANIPGRNPVTKETSSGPTTSDTKTRPLN